MTSLPIKSVNSPSVPANLRRPSVIAADQQAVKSPPLSATAVDADDDVDLDLEDLQRARVRKRDLLATLQQIAILAEAGVNLATALQATIEEEKNATLRGILKQIKASIEGGQDFSAALAQYPRVFNNTVIALAEAGEKTGALGAMLRRAAGYLQAEYETASKIRAAMIYPCIMLVMAIGVTVFLLTFVLPRFVPVFESRHVPLPKITVMTLAASNFLQNYWAIFLGTIAAFFVTLGIVRRSQKGREQLDRIKLSLPVLGPIYRRIAISRCVRTLSTVLYAGVPILDALELAAAIAQNAVIERAWLLVRDGLVEGRRMCDCMKTEALFPRTLVQMVAAGEETGKLDQVLDKVAEFYERELEVAIKTATSLIEPVMIIVMGFVVGTIGLSLLLPIFSLSRPA
ncbi:MAG: type II secretion system F family protein [Thermogutta sp.]